MFMPINFIIILFIHYKQTPNKGKLGNKEEPFFLILEDKNFSF